MSFSDDDDDDDDDDGPFNFLSVPTGDTMHSVAYLWYVQRFPH